MCQKKISQNKHWKKYNCNNKQYLIFLYSVCFFFFFFYNVLRHCFCLRRYTSIKKFIYIINVFILDNLFATINKNRNTQIRCCAWEISPRRPFPASLPPVDIPPRIPGSGWYQVVGATISPRFLTRSTATRIQRTTSTTPLDYVSL